MLPISTSFPLLLVILNFKVTNNKGKEVDIGSICSGGAYAKLISRFRGVDVPGTGISFGFVGISILIASGVALETMKQVVVVNEKFGVRLTDVVSQFGLSDLTVD